jgi:Protein of unknown function (DUF3027)
LVPAWPLRDNGPVTPDSFHEPAPDPIFDQADGSPADGVEESPEPGLTGGPGPVASGETEQSFPAAPAADVPSADVPAPDVASADVASGDVASADQPSAEVASADVASADQPSAGVTSGGVLSGGVLSGGVLSGGLLSGGVSAANVSSGDLPSGDMSSADVASAGVAMAEVEPAEVAVPAAEEEEDKSEPDPVLVDSVDVARAAAVEVGGEDVGEHLGVSTEDAHAVTHAFAATLAGYRGWHWAVTVARSPQSTVVTVDEVVLLPGDGALRAPEWVPWSQRVRAGDLGAGDLLPADPDDARLVPSYFSDGDPALADTDDADQAQMRVVADEIGLGRVRVLSRDGRLDAAERWFEADFGPDAPMAKQAPAHCGTCGFLVAVSGSLGAAFGVCANELSAADAHVVAVEFGCGAHSEAGVDLSNRVEPAGSVYDSGELVMESSDSTPGHDAAVQVDDA